VNAPKAANVDMFLPGKYVVDPNEVGLSEISLPDIFSCPAPESVCKWCRRAALTLGGSRALTLDDTEVSASWEVMGNGVVEYEACCRRRRSHTNSMASEIIAPIPTAIPMMAPVGNGFLCVDIRGRFEVVDIGVTVLLLPTLTARDGDDVAVVLCDPVAL